MTTEQLHCAIDSQEIILAHYQAILNLFRWFDKDSDGLITLHDLQQFFEEYHDNEEKGTLISMEEMESLIQEINQEGKVSFADLLTAVNSDIQSNMLQLCEKQQLLSNSELLATEIEQIYTTAFNKVKLLNRISDRLRCFYNLEVPVVERVIQKELQKNHLMHA